MMTYSIQYQYKNPKRSRPGDYAQVEDLNPEPGEQLVIPNVGDTVILCLTSEGRKMYKVLTRNFSYLIAEEPPVRACSINIVVTDVDDEEVGARLKE